MSPAQRARLEAANGEGWLNANSGGTALYAIRAFLILGDVFEAHLGWE